MIRPKDTGERVWLLCGVALAALFLLRSAGMVFEGAITGLGMFVGIWVMFAYLPALRAILYSCGGVVDILVSFGLPYLVASVLGITGGTMLIATLTCGLLFTFALATRRLGGPVGAASKSGRMIVTQVKSQYDTWREEQHERIAEVGTRGSLRDNRPGSGLQRQEGEGEGEAGRGSRPRLLTCTNYRVK